MKPYIFFSILSLILHLSSHGQTNIFTSSSPVNGSIGNSISTNISVTFSAPLLAASVDSSKVTVLSEWTGRLKGTISVADSTITFNPNNDFRKGEKIFITTSPFIKKSNGAFFGQNVSIEFTTEVDSFNTQQTFYFKQNIIGTQAIESRESRAADMDGDGDLDVVGVSWSGNQVQWYKNDGSENFTSHTISNVSPGGLAMDIIDMDGDGDLDVVVGSMGDDKLNWYENDSGNFTRNLIDSTVVSDPHSLEAVDFDGDGDIDIIVASAGTNKINYFLNKGTWFNPLMVWQNLTGVKGVWTTDMDGDGDLDVCASVQGSNQVSWYEFTGTSFYQHIVSTNSSGSRDVSATDIDQDGDMDLLSASNWGNSIVWHENNNSTWTDHVIGIGINGAHTAEAADFDGDGDLDVICTSPNLGTIFWLENSGNNTFTKRIVASNISVAYSSIFTDINEDGILDVLISGGNSNKVIWSQFTSCSSIINAIPFKKHFENDITFSDSGQHILNDCWVAGSASSDGRVNWRVHTNGTPSPSTGPSSSYSGNWNSKYIYLETSGHSSSVGDSAMLTTGNIDLSTTSSPELSFWYHMYGSGMGSLHVDIFDGIQWHYNVWLKNGQQQALQGDPYLEAVIDLTDYVGDTIQIRFKGVKGTNHLGDIALDEISIQEKSLCNPIFGELARNIQQTQATIAWNDTGNTVQSHVLYGPQGFIPDSTSLRDSTIMDSIVLSNLQVGSDYDVYIFNSCGALGVSDTVGPVTFSTLCGPFSSPFLEDFPNPTYTWDYEQFLLPPCWTGVSSDTISNKDYSGNSPFAFVDWDYWNWPDYSLWIASFGQPHNSDTVVISTPEIIGLDSMNKMISFDAYFLQGYWWYYLPGVLIVGSIADPNDYKTFHPLDTIYLSTYDSHYSLYLDSLSSYNGTDNYIGFSYVNIPNTYAAQVIVLDNVEVDIMPDCPEPKEVKLDSITSNSVNINFTGRGVGEFNIEWGLQYFTLGTGTLDSTTLESYTVSGLPSNTILWLYLQADCSPNDSNSAWVGPFVFRTLCDTASTPYTQGFENSWWQLQAINNASCWHDLNQNNETGNAYIQSNSSSGYNSLAVNTIQLDSSLVYSPYLKGLDSTNKYVKFWAYNDAPAAEELYIGTLSDPKNFNSFHPIDTVSLGQSWTEHVTYLDSNSQYNQSDDYLAFAHYRDSNSATLRIDDIEVRTLDSCVAPYAIQTDSVSKTSAYISWDGISNNYIVEYSISGFTQGNGTIDSVQGFSLTITGLQTGTNYQFYIKNDCSSGSYWMGPYSFTTECDFYTVPIAENFDASGGFPQCWYGTKSGQTFNYIGLQSYRSVSQPRSILIYMNYNNPDTIALVSPEIQGLDSSNKYVEFELQMIGAINEFYVGTMSDPRDMSTFNAIDTVSSALWEWHTHKVYLDSNSAYNGTDLHIALVAVRQVTQPSYQGTQFCYIDDVLIDNVPLCEAPHDLNATADSTQITFSWASVYGDKFDIAYGLTGFNPATGGTKVFSILQKQYTITNLNPKAIYDLYVRDSCGGGWTGPLTLRMECTGPMNGLYTVGASSGPKNFNTLTDAIDNLTHCGVNGPVTIQLGGGSHYGPFAFTEIPGADSINLVTFVGSGIYSDTLLKPASHLYNPTILFDGATGIEFKDMSIISDLRMCVYFIYESHHISFDNCNFISGIAANNNFWYPNSVFYASSPDQSYISILNSKFNSSGDCNIFMNGGKHIDISGNEFTDASYASLKLHNISNLNLSKNDISNSLSYALYLWYPSEFTINENHINSQSDGIFIYQGYEDNNIQNHIENNMIISAATGLYFEYLDSTLIVNNTIKANKGTHNHYGTDLNFYNNIFYTQTGLTEVGWANTINYDYNLYYGNGGTIASLDGEDYYDILGWQLGDTSQNANSVEGDPMFYSPTDLHVFGPTPNDAGNNFVAPSLDIDGDIRPSQSSNTVDIGADEFDVFSYDLSVLSIINPIASICMTNSFDVEVEIRNVGTDTINSTAVYAEIGGSSFSLNYTNQLPPSATDTVIFTGLSSSISGSPLKLTIFTITPGDQNLSNDSLFHEMIIINGGNIHLTLKKDSICMGDQTTIYLNSSTNLANFNWLDSTGSVIKSSFGPDSLVTSGLNGSTRYTVEHVVTNKDVIGKHYAATGNYHTSNTSEFGLVFNASKPFNLDSVTFYTGQAVVGSEHLITLKDSNGVAIYQKTVFTSNLTEKIYLGFSIPVGNGYKILTQAITGNTGNHNNISYPYKSTNNFIQIFQGYCTNCGTIYMNSHYFAFYDWVVTMDECKINNDSIIVNVIGDPHASFTFNVGTADSTKQNVSFDSGSSSLADSVYWDFGDGTFSSVYSPNHTYYINGYYYATLYVYNDCGLDSLSHTIVIEGIGVEESLLSKSLNIYPNPNDGQFRITFKVLGLKKTQIDVMDLRGRMIKSLDLGNISGSQSLLMDLGKVSKGIYLIKVSMDDDIETRRIIIK